jgi:predicted MFS family arabinose efflux permease
MAVGVLGRYQDVLRIGDFRRLLTAFIVDAVGGWAYTVVLVVYVFDRTHSTNWIVATTAAGWVPRLLFSAYAGVLADRYERTQLMSLSYLASFLSMTGAALLVAHDAPIPAILAMSFLTAAFNSANSPAAHAVVPDVVPEKELARANALLALVENVVVVVGPAFGGLLLLSDLPAAGIELNALTFLIAAAVITRVRTRSRGDAGAAGEPFGAQLRNGLQALGREPVALTLVLFCALDSAVYGASTVLYVPLSEKFGTGSNGYSYLLAAMSLGGVLVAGLVGRLSASGRLAPVIVGGMCLLSLPYAVTAAIDNALLGALLQVVAGGGMVIVDVLAITALQRDLPREVLSRVFGVFETLVLVGILGASLGTSLLIRATSLDTALLVVGLGFAGASILGMGPLLRADRKAAAGLAALRPRIALLQVLDLFADATQASLEQLARACEELTMPAGRVVIREGDPADALYVLVDGEVEVSARGEGSRMRHLRTMGPRSYFGEIGLLRGVPRTATVRTTEPTTLWRIGADDFRAAMESGSVSASLLSVASARLARSHPRLAATSEEMTAPA